MKLVKAFVCVSILFLWHGSSLMAQPMLELEEFATGLQFPVNITHAGDERMFVVGKQGIIQIVDAEGQVLPTPFLDIVDRVEQRNPPNEQGLLGLAFHPNYAENGYFYVNYTGAGRATRISRFQVDADNPNHADSTTEFVILTINQPFENHNAGDLAFGEDGFLYIPMGDGGAGGDPQNNGQDRQRLLGKILRIDVDTTTTETNYGIPVDNPFVGDTTTLDEIWALGLRNPFRFSFDRETYDIWIGDVGQNAREELNFLPADQHKGANFGWKCKEASLDFFPDVCPPDSELTFPIFEYTTNANGDGCSVMGGYVYRGSQFPNLYGHYVFADYCSGKMWTALPNPDSAGTWDFIDHGVSGRFEIAGFGENAAGELFLVYLNQGIVYQVKDASSVSVKESFAEGEVSFFPNPFSDKAVLAFTNPNRTPYRVILRDLQGRSVFTQNGVTTELIEIDRKNLAPGIYSIELIGEKRYVGKVQIQP